MPTDETEADARSDSIRSDPIRPDPLPPDVHAKLVADAMKGVK